MPSKPILKSGLALMRCRLWWHNQVNASDVNPLKKGEEESSMSRLRACSGSAALIACVLVFSPALTAQDSRVRLITGKIDETKLHRLAGNTRSQANALNDRGRVADDLAMDHILLQLQRSPEQEQALQEYLTQLQDSASPNYHHWLTAEEFGQRYGAATTTADAGSATYTVHSGDSLWKIARKQSVTVAALKQANNLSGDSLKVGQKLHIPVAMAKAAPDAAANTVSGGIASTSSAAWQSPGTYTENGQTIHVVDFNESPSTLPRSMASRWMTCLRRTTSRMRGPSTASAW